jgi:hypothetical protein
MYKHHELYSSRSDENNPFSIFRAQDCTITNNNNNNNNTTETNAASDNNNNIYDSKINNNNNNGNVSDNDNNGGNNLRPPQGCIPDAPSDIAGAKVSAANRKLDAVYGDHIHNNSGSHLLGSIGSAADLT